jgi:hypothetical protein
MVRIGPSTLVSAALPRHPLPRPPRLPPTNAVSGDIADTSDRIRHPGGIRWVNVSTILGERYIGLEEIDDGIWHVYFGTHMLGFLHDRLGRIEDHNGSLRRRKKPSTMSPDSSVSHVSERSSHHLLLTTNSASAASRPDRIIRHIMSAWDHGSHTFPRGETVHSADRIERYAAIGPRGRRRADDVEA